MSVVAALVMVGGAYAQEVGAGAGRIEIGAFPGGGMFFMQSSNGHEPEFGNYALGASFAVNVNRLVGIEGEGGGSVGVQQTFKVGTKDNAPSFFGKENRYGHRARAGLVFTY